LVIKEYENNINWRRKDIDQKDNVLMNGDNMQRLWEQQLLCFALSEITSKW